jgi:hypothetical protein
MNGIEPESRANASGSDRRKFAPRIDLPETRRAGSIVVVPGALVGSLAIDPLEPVITK